MAGNPWLQHLGSVWKKLKPKGKSYKQAMIEAKKSYKKKKPKK
jgi:hypothetical protein